MTRHSCHIVICQYRGTNDMSKCHHYVTTYHICSSAWYYISYTILLFNLWAITPFSTVLHLTPQPPLYLYPLYLSPTPQHPLWHHLYSLLQTHHLYPLHPLQQLPRPAQALYTLLKTPALALPLYPQARTTNSSELYEGLGDEEPVHSFQRIASVRRSRFTIYCLFTCHYTLLPSYYTLLQSH